MYTEIMLELDELDVAHQQKLFELLLKRKDYTGIARMERLKNLDPQLDARIGALPAAETKAAWLRRPGRSTEEVLRALKAEKRVTVLTALVGHELEPEAYLAIAGANDSLTVAVTILASERAGDDAKAVAAANLAKVVNLGKTQKLDRIRSALSLAPEAISAFAARVETAEGVLIAVHAEVLAPDAAQALVDRLALLLEGAAEWLRTDGLSLVTAGKWHDTHRGLSAGVRLAAGAAQVLGSAWATDAQAKTIEDALGAVKTALAPIEARAGANTSTPHQSWVRNGTKDLRQGLDDALAQRSARANGTSVFALTAQANALTTVEATEALVNTAIARRRHYADLSVEPVLVAILANPNLPVAAKRIAVRACRWETTRMFTKREVLAAWPVSTWAAIACEHSWGQILEVLAGLGATAELSELVLGELGSADSRAVVVLIQRLVSLEVLTEAQVLTVPFSLLMLLMDDDDTTPALRRAVAQRMVAVLGEQPTEVWEAFEQLGGGFTGSIDTLASMCQASVAL